jgi:hypothetical protein
VTHAVMRLHFMRRGDKWHANDGNDGHDDDVDGEDGY